MPVAEIVATATRMIQVVGFASDGSSQPERAPGRAKPAKACRALRNGATSICVEIGDFATSVRRSN